MSTRKEDDEEEDKNSTPTWVWVIVGIVLSLVITLAAMYYLGQINKVSQEQQQQQQQPLTARQQRRKQNMDLLNYINENKDNFNREKNILAKRALKTSIDMTRKQNKIDALYGY